MSMLRTDELDPSDSAVQREIELVMLPRLGEQHPDWRRVNWDTAALELGLPAVWKNANPDAVWKTDSGNVFVAEAYARLGVLKSGHRRKLAMDALKLLALRDSIPDGKRKLVRCLLVVPAELKARLEGDGWFPLALRLAGDVVPVALLQDEREKLGAAASLQGMGQARIRRVPKAEAE